MKTIKKNTKAAAAMWGDYNRAMNNPQYSWLDIFEAYARPSVYKVNAWKYCKKLCEELGGLFPVITSVNICFFVVMFRTEGGELYKVTAKNLYKVEA